MPLLKWIAGVLLILLLISGSLPFLPIPDSIAIPQWFGKPDPFWYGVMAIVKDPMAASFLEALSESVEGDNFCFAAA